MALAKFLFMLFFLQWLPSLLLGVANAQSADPLLGAWKYTNGDGQAVSMVIVHECETTANKQEICHIEVANFTPGKAPGYKRIATHVAILRDQLKKSITTRPKSTLNFYPEQYNSALATWRANAKFGGAKICEVDVFRCL